MKDTKIWNFIAKTLALSIFVTAFIIMILSDGNNTDKAICVGLIGCACVCKIISDVLDVFSDTHESEKIEETETGNIETQKEKMRYYLEVIAVNNSNETRYMLYNVSKFAIDNTANSIGPYIPAIIASYSDGVVARPDDCIVKCKSLPSSLYEAYENSESLLVDKCKIVEFTSDEEAEKWFVKNYINNI